jgi:AraC family transcriptional regulator of adaptative response / DNA-3-methyladenine glycosylase II
MLQFLGVRGIPGIEAIEGCRYLRTVTIEAKSGWIAAEQGLQGHSIKITISLDLVPVLMPLLERLRHLFDVDAEPRTIESHLSQDNRLGKYVARSPGLRVPGTVDGFELALRAVLGQQVSVKAATTFSGRLADALSERLPRSPSQALKYRPFAAERVADATTARVSSIGIPKARAESIIALAKAVTEGGLLLEPSADVDTTLEHLCALHGVGPWTAQYIAMRALHLPDAFPSHDLVLRKACGGVSVNNLERAAEAWRPWRAYAAMHLWRASNAEPRGQARSANN